MVFGSCHKLEPLPAGKKTMWRREMDYLLSVYYIVEFYPSSQTLPDGTKVMATKPKSDIYINLPAMEKLDAMLAEILDSFQKAEFWYADAGTRSFGSATSSSTMSSSSFQRSTHRNEDKWWLPSLLFKTTPSVPLWL
uniref:PRONE domain-containing protein n=1 Tax=Oryza meridionalis TaxID=40149 RepID=A0A0E0EQP0_9ORYZ